MKRIFQITIILFLATTLKAQESCTEKLYRANNLYEKGKINEAIELAKTCAEGSNSTSDQWQAYRLLAMAYLADNQTGAARKAAEKMLEINPTYKPSTLKDPTELIRLIRSIKVIPKFSMGMAATFGGNSTLPNITETFNGANYTKSYSSEASWQLGVMLGYTLNEIISLHSGLFASSKIYTIAYKSGDWEINTKEKMSYLDLPLFARFATKPIKNVSFFADAGAYIGTLLSSQSDFKRYNSVTLETASSVNLNSESRRTNWEYGLLYGMGAMYNFGQVCLALDVKYYLSYANITNTTNRYKNENLFYNYYFIEDNIRLDNLAVSLSLIYNVNYKVLKNK